MGYGPDMVDQPSPPAPTTRPQIRRAAAQTAALVWFTGTILGLFDGMGPLRSSACSLAAVSSGLAAWAVYHVISRRTDGLLMVMFTPTLCMMPYGIPFWPKLISSVIVGLPAAWIAALMLQQHHPV